MTPKKILYSVTCLYPIGLTLLIVFGTFSGFLNADILKILYFCNFLFFIGLLFVFIDIWRRPPDTSSFEDEFSDLVELEVCLTKLSEDILPDRPDLRRYDRIRERIQGGEPIEMAILVKHGKTAKFYDGRHRYAAAMFSGIRHMPVAVKRNEYEFLKMKYEHTEQDH
jgi:hypothetical protein